MKHDDLITEAYALLKRISLLSAKEEDREDCERQWDARRCHYSDVLAAMEYLKKYR